MFCLNQSLGVIENCWFLIKLYWIIGSSVKWRRGIIYGGGCWIRSMEIFGQDSVLMWLENLKEFVYGRIWEAIGGTFSDLLGYKAGDGTWIWFWHDLWCDDTMWKHASELFQIAWDEDATLTKRQAAPMAVFIGTKISKSSTKWKTKILGFVSWEYFSLPKFIWRVRIKWFEFC